MMTSTHRLRTDDWFSEAVNTMDRLLVRIDRSFELLHNTNAILDTFPQ